MEPYLYNATRDFSQTRWANEGHVARCFLRESKRSGREAGPGAAGQRTCPETQTGAEELQQYGAFRESVEKGPFYRTAVKRLGAV